MHDIVYIGNYYGISTQVDTTKAVHEDLIYYMNDRYLFRYDSALKLVYANNIDIHKTLLNLLANLVFNGPV
jgi:hypothetical protein